MKTVNDPRIVALQLKQARPGPVGLHREGFLGRIEVDEAATPGLIAESTPFGRDDRRVVAILARPHDPGMFVQCKGDVCLECQPRAFENYFWAEFGHRRLVEVLYSVSIIVIGSGSEPVSLEHLVIFALT